MRRLPLLLALLFPLALHAQPDAGWQACQGKPDGERLKCFDDWAAGQRAPAASALQDSTSPLPQPIPPREVRSAAYVAQRLTPSLGCRNDEDFSWLSRFWELEPGSDCGRLGVRSYRPLVAAFALSDTVNRQPTSGNPLNNAPSAVGYRNKELRLQFSARSKLWSNLLTNPRSGNSDSLWFAYSQLSYWQLFTPDVSRPFRTTDHEPELMYIHPLRFAANDPNRGYLGLSVVHHSNGQSLPFSRSWNRVVLMAGAERGPVQLQARLWRRIDEDSSDDDNPGISDYYGRAELQAQWQADAKNQFKLTARHNLKRSARGSLRLEWFRTLWEGSEAVPGGLQFYTQVFSGYGDTLIDYNRRRSVLSIGFSLAEW